MPLHYGQSNPRSTKRAVTLALAFLVLLLAIAIMAVWMLLHFRQSAPPALNPSSDTTSQYEEPLTAIDSGMVILDFANETYFILVQTDPARNTVRVVNVPANLSDPSGNTLSALLEKHGSLRVIQTTSGVLELPIRHYITWSAEGAQSFLNALDNGVTYTLPEDIRYTDEEGNSIRLSAGEQKLTGAQAAAVLQYDTWSDSTQARTTAVQMIAAVLDQYLIPQQRLNGYFATLADTAQTNLRIDNFNASLRVLTHLSDSNTGALCRIVPLLGVESEGRFLPNIPAMREQTDLYS